MTAAVRLATSADIDRAAETLALAHHDYEWAMWAFPGPDRVGLLRRMFHLDLEVGVAMQSVWLADDGASVAIWALPHPIQIDPALVERVRDEQNALLGDAATRLAAADALTHSHRPGAPYCYLGTVGTRPERRGHGLATEVVRPVLDQCDRDGIVACLETSSEANVRLYRRLGFVEVFRTTTDDGVLPLIVMHRQPGQLSAARSAFVAT
jgi:GNAT superfamily N-acetyltransferase